MKKSNVAWLLFIFVITYIPIFYNLDKPALFIWDEAIYANNALAMSINKQFLVYFENHAPSFYNVKPPLAIWLQCLCINIFGPCELAVRLPTGLGSLFTCFAVFLFARKNLNIRIGIIAILFLVTSQGYIRPHVSRTGDLDGLLTFWITAYALLSFDLLLNMPSENRKRIFFIAILVFCAFLTKSVAGFMPLAGLFAGMILTGKTKYILTNKYTYIGALAVLGGCISFYLLKESYHPGYWEKVYFSEFTRFTQNVMPWHNQPFWFYFDNIYRKYFKYYIWLIPLSTLYLFRHKEEKLRNTVILCLTFIVSYGLLISIPIVKLDWYDAPLYPVMSLVAAVTLYYSSRAIGNYLNIHPKKWVIDAILIPALVAFPYYQIYKSNLKYIPAEYLENEGFAIRKIRKTNPEIKDYKVIMNVTHPEHIDAVNFYVIGYNHYYGYHMSILTDPDQIAVNDLIMCSNYEFMLRIKNKFRTSDVIRVKDTELLKVEGLLNP